LGNGQAVAQFIRSLPTPQRRPTPVSQHQPHGIRLPTINENGGASSHEVQELRHELQEMKQLMEMSMEIQLDTQRAIRQEVSAILTAFMQNYLNPGIG